MPHHLIDLHVPGLGDSISEARIANWVKADGAAVKPDDVVAELETDKATVELPAGSAGLLRIVKAKGQTVAVGDVIARIEAGAAGTAPSAKAPEAIQSTRAPMPDPAAGKPLSPAVQRMVTENKIDPAQIAPTGPGNRVTKGDVIEFLESRGTPPADAAATQSSRESRGAAAPRSNPASPSIANPPAAFTPSGPPVIATGNEPEETRVEMSKLRETIARRLVEAQHRAAILTTFNEIDMSAVLALREKYKEKFEKSHHVGLGFISFFAKAVAAAIAAVPIVNAQLQDRVIVYKNHLHLGVAVATEKGLIVPVVRYADKLSMAQIEGEIK